MRIKVCVPLLPFPHINCFSNRNCVSTSAKDNNNNNTRTQGNRGGDEHHSCIPPVQLSLQFR